jgi:hypothetical protein
MAAAELGDGQRHQRRAGSGKRRQPHAAAPQARDRLELGLRRGQPIQDRLGVLGQRPTGVGQSHPAGTPLQKRRAGLALQGGDLLRDG